MDETRERIRAWNARPVGELAHLADREFTGALVAGDDVLFLLNGRAVGSTGRPPDAFADGQAHEAPGPALPLLFAMRENGGETKSRGYTNDTPLSEVDETLQKSKFTGYVELSENVLSGDYYMVYYGGRALYAAFVGNETITGQEAFERADDEVGIYEVVDASVDVEDLPTDDEEEETDAAAAGAAAGPTEDDPESEATETPVSASEAEDSDETAAVEPTGAPDVEESAEPDSEREESAEPEPAPEESAEPDPVRMEPTEPETESEPAPRTERASEPASTQASETEPSRREPERPREPRENRTTEAEPTPEPDRTEESEPQTDDTGKPEPQTDDTRESDPTRTTDAAPDPEPESDVEAEREAERSAGGEEPEGVDAEAARPTDPAKARPTGADDTVFDAEEEWRETNSIPALDPDETDERDTEPQSEPEPTERQQPTSPEPDRERDSTGDEPERGDGRLRETLRERTEVLEERTERLEAARRRIEELEANLESARAERDELADTVRELETAREQLETEREELRERVEALEVELEEARASEASEEATGAALDARRALSETNLFVRYDSKSQPTLDDVPAGAAPEEVRANLRLDEHTAFDAEGATVDGEPFEAFLRSTPEYAFVEWAVTELPFEIRETEQEAGLAELYSALPDVDRAELGGAVEIEAEEGSESHAFDVVLRNRMGEPLVVADINAGRDPVTGEMMGELVESASAVAAAEEIGAALYVTASFFEPDALETAESSTGGGLLSRSNKESYVRAGNGYHLCLVESRDGSFYVTVPEL